MHFYDYHSLNDVSGLIQEALKIRDQNLYSKIGSGKTMALIFLNPSLRTRISTQQAAYRLGMNVICFNSNEAWPWEISPHAIMDKNKSEHIKDAAKVISSYVDLIGIRCFAGLEDKTQDQADIMIKEFMKYATVPVINMESAVYHPMQSLTDIVTIESTKKVELPRITLSWAPHPKALPHAVANSFTQWVINRGYPLTITHPPGYELDPNITTGATINYNQDEALADSDYVYVKNWCMGEPYGKNPDILHDWTISTDKMKLTNNAYFMHCLPIRRNVVASDEVLDGEKSLIHSQAQNRMYAAQAVISRILTSMK